MKLFTLSYPRTRTAWMACLLTGVGRPTHHELWKSVKTPYEFKLAMEGYYCNSDCGNVWFLPELMDHFPDAQYVVIRNEPTVVMNSLFEAVGPGNYEPLFKAFERAIATCRPPIAMEIEAARWTPSVTMKMAERLGFFLPTQYVMQMEDFKIELMPGRLELDRLSDLRHIEEAAKRWL